MLRVFVQLQDINEVNVCKQVGNDVILKQLRRVRQHMKLDLLTFSKDTFVKIISHQDSRHQRIINETTVP